MNKILNLIQKKLVPPLTKVGSNRYMIAIRNGISFVIPLSIIGSMFNIVAYLPIPGWEEKLGDFIHVLAIPATATMGSLALVTTLGIGYAMGKEFKVQPLGGAFMSLIVFILTQTNQDYTINTAHFGSTGMFLGMLIAIVTVKVMEFCDKKNITIRLPQSVPPMVSDSFKAIIPGFILVSIFWLISGVMGVNLIDSMNELLAPLVRGVDTLPGVLLLTFVILLLWTAGINGDSVFGGVTEPIFLTMLSANAAAFAAGELPPFVSAYGFYYFGMWMGGTGATLMLVVMMLKSRSKTYKQLGKLCIAPGIFCINEPVTYGFPIMFNPIMMIPFILTPLVNIIIAYFAMSANLVGRVVAMIPWTTPPILNGFLATGGDYRASILQIVLLVVSFVIYYPFFKVAEKKQLEIELSEGALNE